MPGLPFAHCCFFSTVITFLRFASQIFFCYREKVIHILTIELYLYNQHYDLVFKVTVFSTCLSWYIPNWVFFVQSIFADRYIHRRELRLVSLESSSSVEYGIKKIFSIFNFYRELSRFKLLRKVE